MDVKLEVFILFAKEDRNLFLELKKHLAILERQGLISVWDEDQIVGGTTRRQAIDFHLQKASLVLLLISSNFMSSHEYFTLAQQALETHTPPERYVIPVLLHEVDWEHSDIGHLTPLPANREPISSWPHQHAAYLDVAKGVRAIVEEYKQPVGDHHAIEVVNILHVTITTPDHKKYTSDVPADILVDRLLRDFLSQWPMTGNTESMHFSLRKDTASRSLDPSSTLREAGLAAESNITLVSEALGPNEAVNLTIEDDQGERYVTTVLLTTSAGQLADAFFLRTRPCTREVVVKWIISSTQTKQLRLAESLFSQGVCDGALLHIYCIATATGEQER